MRIRGLLPFLYHPKSASNFIAPLRNLLARETNRQYAPAFKGSKKNMKAWKEIHAGSNQIKIYEVANGFRSCWYQAGERKQKFTTKADNAVSFAKATAANLTSGTENTLPKSGMDLAYFRQLQATMGDVPIHLAVEFWPQNHRAHPIVAKDDLDSTLEFNPAGTPLYVLDAIETYVWLSRHTSALMTAFRIRFRIMNPEFFAADFANKTKKLFSIEAILSS